MNESKIVTSVVVFAVVVVSASVGYIVHTNRTRANQREQELEKVQVEVRSAIGKSEGLLNEHKFKEAEGVLGSVSEEVRGPGRASLRDKLDRQIARVASVSADYEKKIASGFVFFEGRFVQKTEMERILAAREAERQKEAAELEAKAEAARIAKLAAEKEANQKLEEERAKRMLASAIRSLPSVKAELDSTFAPDRAEWLIWYLSLELRSMGGKPDTDPAELELDSGDVISNLKIRTASSSPVLTAYRADISDLLESLAFPVYLAHERDVPIRFAAENNSPVLIIGSIATDTIYNNINTSLNSPKKRAAHFVQRYVIPRLLASHISNRLKAAKLDTFGIVFVYGNRNFVDEDHGGAPESLCIVMATRDYVSLVQGALTQEELLRNSSVYLATQGPSFVRAELQLE